MYVLYLHIYICIYVCMYIDICICIYVCVYIYIIYICVYGTTRGSAEPAGGRMGLVGAAWATLAGEYLAVVVLLVLGYGANRKEGAVHPTPEYWRVAGEGLPAAAREAYHLTPTRLPPYPLPLAPWSRGGPTSCIHCIWATSSPSSSSSSWDLEPTRRSARYTPRILKLRVLPIGAVLNSRETASEKCEAVPRRARI